MDRPRPTPPDSRALALDESRHRLFNTSRNPPLLIVHDTETGKQITQLESVQGIDDVWYDAKLKRIYATGGTNRLTDRAFIAYA
jgi:hypothetical protein